MNTPAGAIDYSIYTSLVDVFDRACERFPDHPMCTCGGTTLSFTQVDALSRRLAAFFQHELGLQPGDRIAIQLPNILQYPVAVWGAWRAGLIVVNTNPLYTVRELTHQFGDAGVNTVVAFAPNLPVIEEVRGATGLSNVIATNPGDLSGATAGGPLHEGCIAFLDALDIGKERQLNVVDLARDDLALLQYTGGTTGLSKGAMLSHANLIANLLQVKRELKGFMVDGEEVYVVPLPLYHIYAFTLTFALLAEGGQLAVLIPDPRDLDALVTELERRPFTCFAGINTLFVALCQHERFRQLDFSALKLTVSGGMTLNTDTATAWQTVTGSRIAEGYGLTETSPTVTMNPPDAIRIGTIGAPLPDTEIKIVDAGGAPLPAGEAGELVVRGPQVMRGYWGEAGDTSDALSGGGWLRTGDIAVMQQDGYFRIVDRLKDVIIVSGFNVYPNEVEEVATQHPAVLECAAVGVTDDKSGQAVKLFVVAKDASLAADALLGHCRQGLAQYKLPKHIEFRDELPKSNVGKILRRKLREGDAD